MFDATTVHVIFVIFFATAGAHLDLPLLRQLWPVALTLATLKLIAQPAITAFCAYDVFRLAALPAAIAVLVSALPTGTGPFMLAEFYKREAVVTSGTIFFSTVASIATLTVCLLLLRHAAT